MTNKERLQKLSVDPRRFEHNDCTVRSTAVLLDISYEQAHKMLSELGREPLKGFSFRRVAKALGLAERLDLTRCRVRTALKYLQGDHPRVTLRIRGHVFTVVNGQNASDVYHNFKNCIVTKAWEYRREQHLPMIVRRETKA